jgi:hypothetical protein
MARTKTINIDGEQFTIAPLTIDQVEAYLGNTPGEGADANAWRDITLTVILNSLNNALRDDAQVISLTDLKKRMDLLMVNDLHSAVLEISGLRAAGPGADTGESQAAPKTEVETLTSSISETA